MTEDSIHLGKKYPLFLSPPVLFSPSTVTIGEPQLKTEHRRVLMVQSGQDDLQVQAQEDGEQFLHNCPECLVTCLIKFERWPHLWPLDCAFPPLVCETNWNPVMVTTYCFTKGR